MSRENRVDELDLVGEYLKALGEGFLEGKAPDGTRVVSTPFKYVTGAQVEVAVWEEDGNLWISDRGGLIEALRYELSCVYEDYIDTVFKSFETGRNGVEFVGDTFLMSTTEDTLGQDVVTLVGVLLEEHVHALDFEAHWWAEDVQNI